MVEFLNAGGGPNPNLDPLLKPLGLSPTEQRDLVAFLETLTRPEPLVTPPKLP